MKEQRLRWVARVQKLQCWTYRKINTSLLGLEIEHGAKSIVPQFDSRLN